MFTFFKRLIFPNTYSMEAYIDYLRKNKVVLGGNCVIYSPNHTQIDVRKPYLIKIGDNVKITSGVTILAHDYSVSVHRIKFGDFVGGSLPVTIGNNVFIGTKATILMGTEIGDNCIIGANSVVKGTFPSGSVIAGNPAKVIMKVEEMYERNKRRWVENAKKCALAIKNNSGHIPTIKEMSDGYAWLYLPRNHDTINTYNEFFRLSGDDYQDIINSFMKSKQYYSSYKEFLIDCGFDEREIEEERIEE